LRTAIARTLPGRLRHRAFRRVGRHGKYLLFELDQGLTLLSHLGMSGHWLFYRVPPADVPAHVHVRIAFEDGSELWFQDTRRFGLLKVTSTERVFRDPLLAILGPDPLSSPPTGEWLASRAKGATLAVKNFLLDQRRLAGIGNIYASEILHRAAIDPRRRAGALSRGQWDAIAAQIRVVLEGAIAGMGTTFRSYRTPWNEPGTYGERLLVYDRAGEPCRRCRTPIRRIVQGQRSTFYCPSCQRGKAARPARRRAGGASGPSPDSAYR
jgi:formamidopyrimidine-DNA glycosylase